MFELLLLQRVVLVLLARAARARYARLRAPRVWSRDSPGSGARLWSVRPGMSRGVALLALVGMAGARVLSNPPKGHIPKSTLANRAAAASSGRLHYLTDDVRGLHHDTGVLWAKSYAPRNVLDFVTGGAGTAASPWTGWESAFTVTQNSHIHFPVGVFRKTAKITLDASYDIMVSGGGEEATILDNNVNDHCFEALTSAEAVVTIRDMSIESSFATGSRTAGACIYIDGPGRARVHLERLRLRQHYHGLHLSDVTNPHVEHVQARDNVADGFRVDGAAPSTTVHFEACYASGNGRYGVFMQSVVTGSLIGTISESNTDSNYYFTGCSDFAITSLYSEAAAVGVDAIYLDSVSRFSFVEPRTDSSGRDAMRCVGTAQACRQITVLGGVLGGGTGYGLNDVGLGLTKPFTLTGTQLSGTAGAINDPSAHVTRISDQAAGAHTIVGTATFVSTPAMDAIAERTAAAGVTIDGVLLKDNKIAAAALPDAAAATSKGSPTPGTSPMR